MAIDFLKAIKYLKASPEEKPVEPTDKKLHYEHVNKSLAKYEQEYTSTADTSSINRPILDKPSLEADKFLRIVGRTTTDGELRQKCDALMQFIRNGVYSKLPKRIRTLAREYKNDPALVKCNEDKIKDTINDIYNDYKPSENGSQQRTANASKAQVIISETFI